MFKNVRDAETELKQLAADILNLVSCIQCGWKFLSGVGVVEVLRWCGFNDALHRKIYDALKDCYKGVGCLEKDL